MKKLIWGIRGCKCNALLQVNYVMICKKVVILIKKSSIKFMIILFVTNERTYELDFRISRVCIVWAYYLMWICNCDWILDMTRG